jgi:membrane fusion protein, multidrug efflux system
LAPPRSNPKTLRNGLVPARRSRVDGQLMEVKYKEGDIVQKGAPLVEIDTRPYQAALDQAEGATVARPGPARQRRVDLSRYKTGCCAKRHSRATMATQKALVKQEEGIVKNDQGQIDAAKVNLVYCHINSPITGRVGLRLVDPGNIVHASDTTGLLVITQIQPISVIFTISEDQVAIGAAALRGPARGCWWRLGTARRNLQRTRRSPPAR